MSLHHTQDAACPLCEEKLKTAHSFMADWFRKKKSLYPKLHVCWAYRGKVDQEEAFKEGKTKAHYPHSPHNRTNPESGAPESYALDLFEIDEQGKALFDGVFFAKLSAEIAKEGTPILWGGHFKSLGDDDHFQYHPKPA